MIESYQFHDKKFSGISFEEKGEELDFLPFDLCTDGAFLYGAGAIGAGGAYLNGKVSKIKISSLKVTKKYVYTGIYQPYFFGIRVKDNKIYIAGKDNYLLSATQFCIAQRLDINTLARDWHYEKGYTPTYTSWFYDCDVDSNYLFCVGSYRSVYIEKIKLNRDTGAELNEAHNTTTSCVGVRDGNDGFIYIGKARAGIIAVEKVNKSTWLYTDHTYTDQGSFYKVEIEGDNIFCGGQSPSSGDTQGVVARITKSTMVSVWEYRRNTQIAGFDDTWKVRSDGANLYAFGRYGTPTNYILEKISYAGGLVWSKTIAYALFGINPCGFEILAGVIYLAVYDKTTLKYYIQKRSCATGEII